MTLQDTIAQLRGQHGIDAVIGAVAIDTALLITRCAVNVPDDDASIEKLSKIQRLLIHAQNIAESLTF